VKSQIDSFPPEQVPNTALLLAPKQCSSSMDTPSNYLISLRWRSRRTIFVALATTTTVFSR